MGCTQTKNKRNYNFTPPELNALNETYKNLTREGSPKLGNAFSVQAFNSLFPRATHKIPKVLYKAMQDASPGEKITYQTWLEYADLLMLS